MSSFLISSLDKAFVVQSKNLIESPSSRPNPSGATEFVAITKTMELSRERWKASDHLRRLALSVPSKGSRTSPGGRAALVAGVAQTAQPAHDCGYLRRFRDLLNGRLSVLRVGTRQGVGLPRHIARWTAPPHAVGHCRDVGWMSPVWRIVRSARPLVCPGWQHPCQSRSTSSPDGCHLDSPTPRSSRAPVHRAHRRRRQCFG